MTHTLSPERQRLYDSASASERALRQRVAEGGFAIALSGGGHRATLATLGAVMALVDRGLTSKIMQIASVSGGSITNAFIAQRCRLEQLEHGGLDDIARELASGVIDKGVLTTRWIVILLTVPFLSALLLFAALTRFGGVSSGMSLAIGAAIALGLLLLRGVAVQWLLERRFFRQPSKQPQSSSDRTSLRSISGRSIDHVFCMTDLVLGLPVYASSQHGGIIWRRTVPQRASRARPWFQTFDGGTLSLAEIVRASAAFPGIPPRRMRMPRDRVVDPEGALPTVAFLADGGMWNNLATQVIREDGFIGTHAAWDDGVIRPYSTAPRDIPLFCFNGSAVLKPTRTWMFRVPGVAFLTSLFQTMEILNANTVLPRVVAMRTAQERRFASGVRPNYLDPADLIADLRPTEDIEGEFLFGTWTEELIRKSDPVVKDWERSAVTRMGVAREHRRPEEGAQLEYVLGSPEPSGSYPVCGLANIEDWDALRRSPAWKDLITKEGSGVLSAATTLARIDRELARRLIIRGYLNSYLVSLFLAPLQNGELDRLADVRSRIDRIVGVPGSPAPDIHVTA